MKVELKLYKTFDADLISLNSNGISISALIKTALYNYARGEITRFYVPECKPFELDGRKRFIHIATNIDDAVSIDFLKHQLKPRQRAAFLRTLLRECLITQQLGAFLKNDAWIAKETARMQEIDASAIENAVELKFEERKHDYISKILKPAGEAKAPSIATIKSDDESKPIHVKNSFGDVSDLAISKEKKEEMIRQTATATPSTKEVIEPVAEPIKEIEQPVQEEVVETAPIPEDELPFAGVNENKSFFDEDDEDEDDPTLDDDLFATFKGFMNG